MEFLKARGKTIYAGTEPILLRGFGLGGWFLPEGYMWKLYTKCDRPRRMEAMIERLCGREYAEEFWHNYLDCYITKRDIEWIAKEGFNSIRLPLNARHLYIEEAEKLILSEEMFLRIDRLISWCRECKIYVILDMHGAPGGQTGQNIDDSEADLPYLFMESSYEEELVFLWRALAKRYRDETAVAGYDLLNEPLPNFFSQYNDRVLPLYRRLQREIREIDKEHMLILEGVHWASDFSILEDLTVEEAKDNILLQFHKYWNNPDAESLSPFLQLSDRLNVPLFMGEGGENNCDWYTTAFPLYERLNIGWSFWSYKKMDCMNSPVTFAVPQGWNELLEWIDESKKLEPDRAVWIFNNFLDCIRSFRINREVINALKRELPLRIPCEAYQDYRITSPRIEGAELRMSEPVSIIFENGRTGKVDYQRMAGEEQPPEENLLVQLAPGHSLGYLVRNHKEALEVTLKADGKGQLLLSLKDREEAVAIDGNREYRTKLSGIPSGQRELWLICTEGVIQIDYLYLA